MTVKDFVAKLRVMLKPEEFFAICAYAKGGKMGFGEFANDWGTKDGKG